MQQTPVTELPKYKCLRCNHEWTPRIPNPPLCPKCHSPYWDVPKKDNGSNNEGK